MEEFLLTPSGDIETLRLAPKAEMITMKITAIFMLQLKAWVGYNFSSFMFSSNDEPSKAMKNDFYFIEKALSVLEIFIFL